MKSEKIKFEFNTEFQQNILGYTIRDDSGYRALELYKDYYFELIEHQAIAAALKSYFKKKNKIPRDKAVLKEELRVMFKRKEFRDSLLEADRIATLKLVDKLYKKVIKDGNDILEACTRFASFIEFKDVLENINVYDFSSYEPVIKDLQKAINKKSKSDLEKGTFLVADIRQRQADRKAREPVQPFPFWQLNALTNANGAEKGSLFVLLDKAKGFKTGVMINLIKGYMRLKKNVILFDLENGENSMALRMEQTLANKNKAEVLSGDHDRHIQKILRQYSRIGVEVVIKRLPAYSTATDLKYWLDYYYNEYGLTFEEMFIDYVGLMGSIKGNNTDENSRIGNAYLEVKNLADEYGIWHTWTPHHIGRNAYVRRATKYEANDTAKCIDIHRHVDGMFGVNQNEDEKEGGVYRIEIIDQRDGVPEGRCYLWGNEATQRVTEFTKNQVKEYLETQHEANEEKVKDTSAERAKASKGDL
jgi:hypothetical protein